MTKRSHRPIDIKKLRFLFDETWDDALEWDRSPEFLDGVHRLQHTHGVDIVGRRFSSQLWLIEVKDPRGHEVEYRRKGENPATLTAEKARDTLAGIVWAIQRFEGDRASDLGRTIFSGTKARPSALFVVLWLEGIRAAEASAYTAQLERALRWLNPTVIVTNRSLWRPWAQRFAPGLEVESLPGATNTTR